MLFGDKKTYLEGGERGESGALQVNLFPEELSGVEHVCVVFYLLTYGETHVQDLL